MSHPPQRARIGAARAPWMRLALTLGLAAMTLPAQESHRFRFFLHPDLAAGLSGDELERRLTFYVEDLNTILAKQTIRRLSFNPETDITLTSIKPHTDWCSGELPRSGFEIWAHADLSTNTDYGTYGGYMGLDQSGAGVAAGLHWDAVHDRQALRSLPAGRETEQYWRQLHHMIHEIEHVFGAGAGEYYTLRWIQDHTGVDPLFDCNYYNPQDPFWLAHADYLTDPLTLWTPSLDYSNLMARVRLADLSAAVLNASVRGHLEWTLPDLSRTRLVFRERDGGAVVSNAHVLVWKFCKPNPPLTRLLVDTNTPAQGAIEFPWSGAFNNYDLLLLVKAWHPVTGRASCRWISVFDAQAAKMVEQRDLFETAIELDGPPQLHIERAGTELALRWRLDATNYVLQSRPTVNAGDWLRVTNAPTTNTGWFQVRLPHASPVGFFRLLLSP